MAGGLSPIHARLGQTLDGSHPPVAGRKLDRLRAKRRPSCLCTPRLLIPCGSLDDAGHEQFHDLERIHDVPERDERLSGEGDDGDLTQSRAGGTTEALPVPAGPDSWATANQSATAAHLRLAFSQSSSATDHSVR